MGGCGSKERMTVEAAPAKHCKVIKVRHAGGYTEEFDRPVMTLEVMQLHSRHWVTQPDVFKAAESHLSVLPPHTLLMPGHTYYLVPFRTLYRRLLRQAISKPHLLTFLCQQGLSAAEFDTHLNLKPNPGSTHSLAKVAGKTERGRGLSHHDHHHHHLRSTHQKNPSIHHTWPLNDDRHGANHKKKATIDQNLAREDDRPGAYHKKKTSTDLLNDDRHRVNHQKKTSTDLLDDDRHRVNHQKKASIDQNLPLTDDGHLNHQRKASIDHNLSLLPHHHGVKHQKSTAGGHDFCPQLVYNHHQTGPSLDEKLHKIEPVYRGSKNKMPEVLSDHVSDHDLNLINHINSADHMGSALIDYDIHQSHGVKYQIKRTQQSLRGKQSNSNSSKNQEVKSMLNPKDESIPMMVKVKSMQTKKCGITPVNRQDFFANVALESNQQQARSNNIRTFNQGTLKTLEDRGSLISTKTEGSSTFETRQKSILREKQDTLNDFVKAIKPPLEPKRSEALKLQCVQQRAPMRRPPFLQRSMQDHTEMQIENLIYQLIMNAKCTQNDVLNLINRNDHYPNMLERQQQKERGKTLSSFIGQVKSNPEVVIKKPWSLRELMIQSPYKMIKREGDNHDNKISDPDSTHIGKSKSSSVAKCHQEKTDHVDRMSDQTTHANTCLSKNCNEQHTVRLQEKTDYVKRMSDETTHANICLSKNCNEQHTVCLRKLHRKLSRSRFRSHSRWEPSLQPVHEYFSE